MEGLPKTDLPAQLCAFTSGVLRAEAMREPGWYDVIHSHYWLSGQIGWLAKDRWGVPLVHSMHTMAKVKNANLAARRLPRARRPYRRGGAGRRRVRPADRLDRAGGPELVELYDADPAKVVTVAPGVDLERFKPGSRSAARKRLGLPDDAVVLAFVGRIQPLKAPDVVLHAAARLVARDPALRDKLVVLVVGGASGSGLKEPAALAKLAGDLGISDLVRFEPPADQARLVDVYRAATVTMVPSHNESFGLVALESQACGTPVIAAAVGGLRTAVTDGRSGLLIPSHDPDDYAAAVRTVIGSPSLRRRLAEGAVEHASQFGWSVTAAGVLETYREAIEASRFTRTEALAL